MTPDSFKQAIDMMINSFILGIFFAIKQIWLVFGLILL